MPRWTPKTEAIDGHLTTGHDTHVATETLTRTRRLWSFVRMGNVLSNDKKQQIVALERQRFRSTGSYPRTASTTSISGRHRARIELYPLDHDEEEPNALHLSLNGLA